MDSVSSVADAMVTWLRDGNPMKTGPRLQQRQDGTRLILTMDRVTQVDDGMYGCQLTTAEGLTVASATWMLRVSRKSSTPDPACPSLCMLQSQRSEVATVARAPRFIRRLSDLKVMDGSRVSMTVELSGEPPSLVMWLHDGQEVSESEDFHLLREENRYTLQIQEVFPEDTGTYSCRAWNQYGEDQTQAQLIVEEPQDGIQPWFITKPKAVSAITGQHVLLSCAIAGDPFPQYTWTRADQNRALSSGGDYELLQKEDVISLLIRSAAARGRPGRGSAGAATLRGGDRGGGGGEGSRLSLQQVAGEEQNLQNLQLLHLEEEKKKKEEEDLQAAPRGLLKRCVETRECGEEELRQREAQQLDFRSLLGRRAFPTSHTNVDTNTQHDHCHQMDFKANLRGVKGKAEEKMNSPQQVDFRSVLGKKGTSSSNGNKLAETPSKGSGDFRSVLSNKKKTETPEKNGESEKVNNCVDGGIHDQKSEGGGIVPEFMEKLKDVTVLDGQRLRLECRLDSTIAGGVTVTWTLDGKIIKPSKFIVLANEGQSLHTHTHTHSEMKLEINKAKEGLFVWSLVGAVLMEEEEEEEQLLKLIGFRLY
ncbi:hypothetical protein GOODEAATRI_013624 [Goodea atripinnis]|uniref:Ig-like domain-containing protein n=1 Tax=Goodea atripinnis TaxID=208336 RepID=A0ABV0P3U6_9TELE